MASLDNLEIQITASAKGTTDAIDKLIDNLGRLDKALSGVNTKEFAANMEKITQALDKIEGASKKAVSGMSSVSTVANMITSSLRSAKSGTMSFISSLFGIHKQTRSLASTFGSLYANFFWLRRIFQKGLGMIGIASDLVEVQNVVDVTFQDMAYKLEDFSKTSIKSFGISELAAKTYASQFQAMLKAMKINTNDIAKANERLASNTLKAEQMMAKGYEIASSEVADLSINLTKLSADMASFYNQQASDVAKRLQSGVISGQSRALRQYGLDLTIATLNEYAMSKGIQQNVADMTQAQKTMLRYEYVMDRMNHVMGDFTKTANTWANQVKIMKMQFQQLGAVIGGALINSFKPAIQGINRALNTMIKLVEKAVNAIGKLLGWQIEIQEVGTALEDIGDSIEDSLGGGGGGGGGGKLIEDADDLADDLGDGADGADDLADALGDASKAAKKLKDYTLGIDELNIFRPEEADDLEDAAKAAKKLKDATDDAGKGSGGSGGGGGGAGSGAAEVTGGEFRFEKYESDINSWYELGQRISDAIADGLESIDWTKIQTKMIAFSKNLADLLNGIVDNERMWKDIGHTLAYGMNSALISLDTFLINFHWAELGRGLGLMINQAIADFEWSLLGKTIADGINAAVSYFYNLGITLDFYALGVGIATAINKFFKTFDFKQLAEGLNVWIDNLEDAISGFFSELDTDAIFNGLKTFFENLQPDTVMAILAIPLFHFAIALGSKVGAQLVEHLVTGIVTKIVSIPISLAEIGSAIALLFSTKAIPVIINWSTFAFELSGTPNLAVIVDPFLQNFEEEFARKWPTAADIIGKAGAGAIIGGLVAAWIPVVGIPVGMIIGALVGAFTTDAFKPLLEKIKYVFSWEFLGDVWNSAQENFKRGGAWVILGAVEGMIVFIGGLVGTIVECVAGFFDMVWNAFKTVFGIGSPAKEMMPIGENIILGVIEGLTSKFDAFTSALNGWFAQYVVPWFTIEKWVNLASGIKSGIMAGWNLMVANWKTSISNWWNNDVLSWFTIEKWKEVGKNLVDGFVKGIEEAWNSAKGIPAKLANWFLDDMKAPDAFDEHSPSRKTEEIGKFAIEGLLLPFDSFTGSFKLIAFALNVLNAIAGEFTASAFSDIGKNAINSLVASLQDNLSLLTDFTGTLFETLKSSLEEHWTTFKDETILSLLTDLFTVFLPPYFSLAQWAVLFDMMHEMFVQKFEQFRVWWDTEAMQPWWADDVVPWFTAEQWFPDVFDQVESHYKKAWEAFIAWWRESMLDWWREDLIPWFEFDKWYEQFQHIFKAAEKTFDEIKEIIRKKMKEAEEIVREVTEHMVAMIQEVIDKVHEAIEAINHLASLNAEFGSIGVPGFAAGGFPSTGSLFIANEAGPELVGTVNGNTAVANHGEITGIRDAVYETGSVETQLLSQIVDIAGAILAKDPVLLGDREIAMASNRGQQQLGVSLIS